MRLGPTSAARVARAFVVALGVLVVPLPCVHQPSALAQTKAEAQRARELFKKSEQSYREGRFQEAVDLLTEAYRLDPKPVLLYNTARAYEGLGDVPHALEAYKSYLEKDPNAGDRGALEQRIATLERQQQEKEALERQRDAAAREKKEAPPPAASPPKPVEPPPRSPSPLPWVVAGVGVAGVGAGLVLGVMAKGKHDEAVKAPKGLDADGLQKDGERLAIGANIALIAGGAIAAAGVVWGIVDVATSGPSSKQSGAAHRAGIGLGAGRVVVVGSF